MNSPLAIFSNGRDFRSNAMALEKQILKMDGAEAGNNSFCPLEHQFSDGIYVRKIFIPKGTVMTGRIHKHEHPNFLMMGKVKVITERDGGEILTGPLDMISPAGTKRVLLTLTDVVWITVHPNPENITNTDELEKMIAVDTYEELDRYLENKTKSPFTKLIKFFKRK